MSIEIVVPDLGEAGAEATVSRWLKAVGDPVKKGEAVVVLETDKIDLEVAADAKGILKHIAQEAGQDVVVGQVLGTLDLSAEAVAAPARESDHEKVSSPAPAVGPVQTQPAAEAKVSPVARRVAEAQNIDLLHVAGSGPQGRITREDVELAAASARPQPDKVQPGAQPMFRSQTAPTTPQPGRSGLDHEERVPMSRRRRTIARRLVEAQHTAAMLTTFNDVDMTAVMALRARHKEAFRNRYGVSLGLSSFFVRAAIGALRIFPRLNAEIDGDDIILKRHYDIGLAIGAEEGLVVPVLRGADRMSFAEIETAIKRFVQQADEGTLSLEDLRGGTFTITNGGIFGSLLSTPILNPPEVAILGLHRIEDRPAVINGEVVVRSMMYMALSYDHRIVDGREAVQFLVRVKELIEDPEVLLTEG